MFFFFGFQDRKEQRSSFRDIVRGVEEGDPPSEKVSRYKSSKICEVVLGRKLKMYGNNPNPFLFTLEKKSLKFIKIKFKHKTYIKAFKVSNVKNVQ